MLTEAKGISYGEATQNWIQGLDSDSNPAWSLTLNQNQILMVSFPIDSAEGSVTT